MYIKIFSFCKVVILNESQRAYFSFINFFGPPFILYYMLEKNIYTKAEEASLFFGCLAISMTGLVVACAHYLMEEREAGRVATLQYVGISPLKYFWAIQIFHLFLYIFSLYVSIQIYTGTKGFVGNFDLLDIIVITIVCSAPLLQIVLLILESSKNYKDGWMILSLFVGTLGLISPVLFKVDVYPDFFKNFVYASPITIFHINLERLAFGDEINWKTLISPGITLLAAYLLHSRLGNSSA